MSITDEYQTPVVTELEEDKEVEKGRIDPVLPPLPPLTRGAVKPTQSAPLPMQDGETTDARETEITGIAKEVEEDGINRFIKQEQELPPLGLSLSTDNLANARPLSQVDVVEKDGVSVDVKNAENVIEDMGTWEIGFPGIGTFDTGIDLDPDWAAGLVGLGSGYMSSINGIKQLFGVDEENMQDDARFVRALKGSEEYGGNVVGGEVLGYVVEPVGFLIPGIKAGKISTMAAKGAAVGAAFGFLDYVDEETGEKRINNVAAGLVLGGGMGAGIGYATKKLFSKNVQKILPEGGDGGSASNPRLSLERESLSAYEEQGARFLNEGMTIKQAEKAVAKQFPELAAEAEDIIKLTGDIPDFAARRNSLHLENEVARTGGPTDVIAAQTRKLEEEISLTGKREPYTNGIAKSFSNGLDNTVGLISYIARKISPEFHQRMLRQQTVLKVGPEKIFRETAPFEKFFRTHTGRSTGKAADVFTDTQIKKLNSYILNSEFSKARKFITETKGEEALTAFNKVTKMYEDEGQKLVSEGVLKKGDILKDYWHRYIMPDQRENYLTALGEYIEKHSKKGSKGKEKYSVDKIISDYERHVEKVKKDLTAKGRVLSAYDESNMFSRWFLSTASLKKYNTAAHKRAFTKIPDELQKFYADPIASTHSWIHKMTRERGLVALLGNESYVEGASKIAKDGVFDVSAAVNKFFDIEASTPSGIFKKLGHDERETLKGMVKLIEDFGMSSPGEGMRIYKSLVASVFIGNPLTAFLQIGDLAVSAYKYGLSTAYDGFMRSIKKKASSVGTKEMGVSRHSQEFEDIFDVNIFKELDLTFLPKVENKGVNLSWISEMSMKYSGFTFMDELGKSTAFTSALVHHVKAVNNPAGKAFHRMRRRYEPALGTKDFNTLIKDLRKIDIDKFDPIDFPESVSTLIMSEVSDVLPITALESVAWSKNGSIGRTFSTLKSYMFKTLDIMRRDILDQTILAARQGNKAAAQEGMRNFVRFVGMIGVGNLAVHEAREILKGETPFEDFKDTPGGTTLAWKLLSAPTKHSMSLVGLDGYALSDLKKGGVIGGTAAILSPPVPFLDVLLKEWGKKNPEWAAAIIKQIPWFGKAVAVAEKQAENPLSLLNTGL